VTLAIFKENLSVFINCPTTVKYFDFHYSDSEFELINLLSYRKSLKI